MFTTSLFIAAAATVASAAPLSLIKRDFTPATEYVFGESYLANATFGNFIAKSYSISPSDNSCNYTHFDSEYVVSVKTNHTKLDEVCNLQVNVSNADNGKWVIARVVDECVECSYNYLLLSPAAFDKVSDAQNFTATYTFSNTKCEKDEQYYGPAPVKQSNDGKAAPAPASSSKKADDSKDSSPAPTTSSQKEDDSSKDDKPSTTYTPKTTSTKKEQEEYHPTTTSTKKQEEVEKTTYAAPKTTKKEEQEYKPTTTSAKKTTQYEQPKPTTSEKKQESQPAINNNSGGGGGGDYSGRATWYTQNGNAGSCGAVNSDSAYIVAMNAVQGGGCGRTVHITNTANGRSINAQVADLCPGCGYGSLDLSTGAFQGLGSLDSGVLPITWSFA